MIDVFDNAQLDATTQMLLNIATEEQATAVHQGYKVIVNAANSLIGKYQTVYQKINLFESQLKSLIKSWHSVKAVYQRAGESYRGSGDYRAYLQERARIRKQLFNNEIQREIQELYVLAMKFQEYINAALGQTVLTTYIWVGAKGIPQTYVIYNMEDFLKLDVDRYGNVVMRYRNNIRMLREHTQKLEAVLKDSENFNLTALESAYKEATYRYKTYKTSKGGSYILWLYPYGGQKWNGAYVSSFGSINEAYGTLILHEDFNPSQVPEDYMELFMNVVLGVTNLSGTLQGDTTVGTAEMAIKSKGASTLSIQQLYNIANDIINNKLNNFGAIKNYLTQKKAQNKQAQQKLNISYKELLNIEEDTRVEDILKILKE